MSNELMKQNGKTLDLTPDKIELIRKTVAKDANNDELAMFLHLAKAYELDPFLKELVFIKRRIWNDYKKSYDEIPTMMVSRDGLLAIAHRSGAFDGMETNALYDEKKNLTGAECTVWNKSFSHPIKAKVLFKEYAAYKKDGSLQALWGTKPTTMIQKVAEAQALRKAFNIKGVYIHEELEAEIEKDSKTELEYAGDALKVSAAQLEDPAAYDKWSEEIRTEIIEAVFACETPEALRSVTSKYKTDMQRLMEKDRAHIQDIIDSQFQTVVSSETADNSHLKGEDGEMDDSEVKVEPEPSVAVSEGKETEVIDPKDPKNQEAFGKTWLPVAVKEIQAIKTKAEFTVWKNKNISNRMKLEKTQREYLYAVLKTKLEELS